MNLPDLTSYDPKGIAFYDAASQRTMKLVQEGHWSGWLVWKHPDGQWVSLRKAKQVTDADALTLVCKRPLLIRCTLSIRATSSGVQRRTRWLERAR